MGINKTTFRKIVGLVDKRDSHRITQRGGLLQRKTDRLKKLGVRARFEQSGMPPMIPRHEQQLYDEAYEALKNSDKPWATESEIRAILYGDKELSRTRSAEVIEVMRRAGVKGFKETDELTPGDVYSERLLGALNKSEKSREMSDRRSHIADVMSRENRIVSTLDIDPSLASHTPDSGPTQIVQLKSSSTKGAPMYEGRAPLPRERQDRPITAQELTEQLKKKKPEERSDDEEKNDDDPDVPLTFDLEDF